MKKIIILRGNSGSGKTTVARALQKKFGYNTMVISQDEIRRNILWVKDGVDTKALPLMIELMKYGYEHCDVVILEGIMYDERYSPLFKTANELYGMDIYAYYFDIPFEETVRRHNTRDKKQKFGEEDMRRWWREKDFSSVFNEKIITSDIDADSIYDEDLNYRDHMAEVVKLRKKLCPVRMEMTRELDETIVERFCEVLGLKESQVFRMDSPMDLSFLFRIQDELRTKPELFYQRRIPQNSPMIDRTQLVIPQILEKDILLSYPYESIKPFLTMLHEAANDEDVVSIKMTLYRVAKQSKVVEALIEAAENGKEVFVLVELKARFDEENNIGWSRLLEDAGCHVIYGLDGYKVHSKLCQIVKKKDGNVEYYTQIGTGNYNEKTARLYTDLSLMTADPKIGTEAARVFQALAMGETVEDMEHLLVAPKCLQNKVLAMIDEEIEHAKVGEQAYIGLKMNSLTDKRIMNKLVEASCAGVHIDMVVRGICCLIPGVKGQTENIHIISIVGRFLEHSRIYIFGTQERAKIYISSADFMTRNTLRRVEVAAPIEDPDIRMQIQEMFVTMLSDNRKARTMNNKGNYKIEPSDNAPLNSQEVFLEQAYDNAAPVVMEK